MFEAGSFTVNSYGDFHHEVTLHDVPGRDDFRVDITADEEPPDGSVRYFDSAFIENANGKTSHVLVAQPSPARTATDERKAA